MQWLRQEIDKKDAQISAANREYKAVLESRNEGAIGNSAPRSAAADTSHLNRLESELGEIKQMLTDYGLKGNRGMSGLIGDLDSQENSQLSMNDNSTEFIK